MSARSVVINSARLFVIVCFGAFCFAAASTARADTMGTLKLSNCGSDSGCPAATYAFDISSTSASLTITITGTPGSTNDFIGSVDLGFAPSATISGLSLTAAPSPLADWTSTTGSLNSNGGGCGTNSGAFVCATALPLNPLSISQGGVYVWTWTYNSISPSQIASDGSVHVGTQYGPNSAANWKGLIVSETVSTLSEPSTLIFLGAGLLALIAVSRRLARA